MTEAQLTLKPIQELLTEKFFVPNYQRGYRWSSEEVKDLLKDLNEFRLTPKPSVVDSKQQPFYCLQPVVVKNTDDGFWEVIDGQQRLTTILLILHYLNETEFKKPKPIYSLNYATRGHSDVFLKRLETDAFALENVDHFHLNSAYSSIINWFEKESKTNSAIQSEMYPVITNQAEVIWYDISRTNESAIEVFTRLNIGKIPLTNAELIKALFLRKANFEEHSADLKQIQIASEWDMMENTLQQEDFWFFIYNQDNPIKYETRIEFIFDAIYDRKIKHSHRYTYNKFAEEFRNQNRPGLTEKIDDSWQQIKKYFLTIEQWYKDHKWYHLIGYLVATGESLRDLKEIAIDISKDEFEEHLLAQIRKKVAFNLDGLNYNGNKQDIRNVLLLFNIETILKSKSEDIRFPFYRLKKTNWDIEHIASQTDAPIKTTNQLKAWVDDLVDYLTGFSINSFSSQQELTKSFPEEFKEIGKGLWGCYHAEKIEDDDFETTRVKVEAYFKEDSLDPELKDSIGNLALLDDKTNRSYKNALFPIKRKRIIKNDSTGVMVPLCTKNVFMKFYSGKLSEVMYWQNADILAYTRAIKTTLIKYLPENENND